MPRFMVTLRAFLARRSARRDGPAPEEPVREAEAPAAAPVAGNQPSSGPWRRNEVSTEATLTTVDPDIIGARTQTSEEDLSLDESGERSNLGEAGHYAPRITMPALPDDWTRRMWIAAATVLVIGAALLMLVMGVYPKYFIDRSQKALDRAVEIPWPEATLRTPEPKR